MDTPQPDHPMTTSPHSSPSSSPLSPPDSQHPTPLPRASNSNGKRPIQTISNGEETPSLLTTTTTAELKAPAHFPPKTHQASGYTWTRMEEEPGFGWLNRKAQDEGVKAWEGLCHKGEMVGDKYGDPFEMAEREKAIIERLKR